MEDLGRAPAAVLLDGWAGVVGQGRDDALRLDKLDLLRAEIEYVDRAVGPAAPPEAVAQVLGDADEAMRRVLAEGPAASFTAALASGVTAVVHADGSRPVGFVKDGFVDLDQPALAAWRGDLEAAEGAVRHACAGTGRIGSAAGGAHVGTAWVVGDGLLVTNLHVLRQLRGPGGASAPGPGPLPDGITVDLTGEVAAGGAHHEVAVTEVVAVGTPGDAAHQHPVARSLNFDGLDVAVLRFHPGAAGSPEPLGLDLDRAQVEPPQRVFVVGYPGGPLSTTPAAYACVFGGRSGVKRIALGTVTAAPGQVPHDPRGWILEHDASTIGGNSGSPVVALDGRRLPVAVHVGGHHEHTNWAHAVAAVPWSDLHVPPG
ncbi:trypsin-like serine peptidase [Cellulomonas sp. NS3]|uniref:trypsin-like serine peptidase n=1 Tax=Cellulomonas sp. NS3 TaxID=2973977 RepID=UPI0021618DC3|nr:serine protease [Cellulomonas sp. NS3]